MISSEKCCHTANRLHTRYEAFCSSIHVKKRFVFKHLWWLKSLYVNYSMQMTYHLRISWAHRFVKKKNFCTEIFQIWNRKRLRRTEPLRNHISLQRLLHGIGQGLKRFNWMVYNTILPPFLCKGEPKSVEMSILPWLCFNVMIAGNSSPLMTTTQRVKKSGKMKSWQWCWQIPCSAPSALTLYIIYLNECNLLPCPWTSMGWDEAVKCSLPQHRSLEEQISRWPL